MLPLPSATVTETLAVGSFTRPWMVILPPQICIPACGQIKATAGGLVVGEQTILVVSVVMLPAKSIA